MTVVHNPPTAPPILGGGSCDLDGVRAFDLSPFLGIDLTEHFPFGMFSWTLDVMESWTRTPAAPSYTFTLGNGINMPVNLGAIEPAMGTIRLAVLILTSLGIVWMLATASMKLNTNSDD